MSALVKNTRIASAPSRAAGGFGLGVEERAQAQDQIGGAALTILLVLYPALASVAIVVVTFLLSGRGVFA